MTSESMAIPLDVPASWERPAFGCPGEPPTWDRSDKGGVATALGGARLWLTFSHGILSETFFPRPDCPSLRDLRLLVVHDGVVYDERADMEHAVEQPDPCVPLYRLINTSSLDGFRIEKTLLPDPRRSAALLCVRFVPLRGRLEDFQLFVVAHPHLANRGGGNDAWIDNYKGRPLLFAARQHPDLGSVAMALANDVGWVRRSVGFLGRSDAGTDLARHQRMTWSFNRAHNGNVALGGEINLAACGGTFRLVVAFDREWPSAGLTAILSLLDDESAQIREYTDQWQQWHKQLNPLDQTHPRKKDLFRTSAAVVRIHRSAEFTGGGVASLSTPWGQYRGDETTLGYHVVWVRDLVNAAKSLLAAGACEDARRVIQYLWAVQEADGHWPQDMWLDGRPAKSIIQLDETASAILLVDLAHRERAWGVTTIERFWPMVRAAAVYLVTYGPQTQEDRWEDTAGFSTYTLATEVAALLIAAQHADEMGESSLATIFRETSDCWNASIESWTYVRGTELASRVGVDGYYIRIAPAELALGRDPQARLKSAHYHRAIDVVSVDALALVRFGLRRPDDPRILNTLKVIDATLKVQTPRGPCWRRYNHDRYGEHADGSPFINADDDAARGRAWPLLTGERGMYELSAGSAKTAGKLLDTMADLAGDCGMLPEQVWDSPPIPEKNLFPGRPSGSAMPLAWAHAEYLTLRRSLVEGRPFDLPPDVARRYGDLATSSPLAIWRLDHQPRLVPAGKRLRIELAKPANVRVRLTTGEQFAACSTARNAIGRYVADLPTEHLPEGAKIRFWFCASSAGESGEAGEAFEVQFSARAKTLPAEPPR